MEGALGASSASAPPPASAATTSARRCATATVLGVLVVKVDLDHTETLWGSTPEQLLVTDTPRRGDPHPRPEWRFRATRGLGVDEREQIAFDQPYPTLYPQDPR